MAEIKTKLITSGIGLAAIAASPFVKKAASGMANKENWQWWNKTTDIAIDLTEEKE